MRVAANSRLRALAMLFGLSTIACHTRATTRAPVAIAIAPTGERLFVAEAGEMWSLSLSPRKGPARSRPHALEGPCASLFDLEVWHSDLFALCTDGRVFRARMASDGRDPAADDWHELPVHEPSFIALQRSDAMLLGVTTDGQLRVLAADSEVSPEHVETLDRFRGPDRGGPNQIGLATFVAYEPLAAHALALRRGPELAINGSSATLTCSISARNGVITDLAVPAYDDAVAAVIVEASGRTSLFYAHGNPNGLVLAGVFEPRGGRRIRPQVRCEQL